MNKIAYSFLSVTDQEAKLVTVDQNGIRRENSINLEGAKKIVEKMKAKGLPGTLPRSTRPRLNVREFVAGLK